MACGAFEEENMWYDLVFVFVGNEFVKEGLLFYLFTWGSFVY